MAEQRGVEQYIGPEVKVKKEIRTDDTSSKPGYLKMQGSHLSTFLARVYWIAQFWPVNSSPEIIVTCKTSFVIT